jgi:hypothetical protein
MQFNIDDRVCLTVGKSFADGKVISAGTTGTIRDIYQIFNAYLVKFEGVGLPRMISEDDLRSC